MVLETTTEREKKELLNKPKSIMRHSYQGENKHQERKTYYYDDKRNYVGVIVYRLQHQNQKNFFSQNCKRADSPHE